jgi:hypothetical protein
VIWLPQVAYEAGIEEHVLDGIPVRVYTREKTIADCFRYETRVGRDVVLESLRNYIRQGKVNVSALIQYARIDRVEGKIQPLLEALLYISGLQMDTLPHAGSKDGDLRGDLLPA